MKFFFLSIAICALFFSCQSEEDYFEENKIDSEIPYEHQAIIRQLGLDITTLIDKGEDYLLEGSLMLSKKEMKNYILQPDTNVISPKQGYVKNHLISLIKAQDITIRVDASIPQSGVGSDWRQAVITAINEWNKVGGTCLKFHYTTASTADITVKRTTSYDNAVAWTWLPSGQKPSNEIFVNSEFDNYQYKANTLIHEMGHTIGLLHAHVNAASQGGVTIPGTPEIDNASIMSYNRDRSLLPGFSNHDLVAIRKLYPVALPEIQIKQMVSPSSNPSYTISFTNYEAGGFSAYASWEVIGGEIISSPKYLPSKSILVKRKSNRFSVTARQDGRDICTISW